MRGVLIGLVGLLLLVGVGVLHSQQPGGGKDEPYAGHVARSEPRTPEEERKAFHLPPGFEAQLVAAEPDIQKPINLNFDDRGRLWVSGSVEYPFPARNGAPRDKVLVLDELGDDGRARSITTFCGGLNIPIGVLPLADGALVYSIPNIQRLHDDGAGRAGERDVLYGTYGYGDTHGMTGSFTWGFDGWVYACHGFSNTSTVRAADGSAVTMQSGNTYRMRPEGTHVEQYTHGQVNPFGLAWDPLGNLYSCDCETKPIYQLLRGAWYPSFGKPDDGLGFAPAMMTHSHESTAIAGITYYAADHFPTAYRDTIFVGNVVTNRINHDKLERHGSTYRALRQPDFLVSDDPWFRPVDIKLGPDGALYVADFYNRIIGHYEVPLDHPGRDRERGRIWRIVYRGAEGTGLPHAPRADWAAATVPELVHDLGHPNLTVRMNATNELAARKDPSVHGAVAAVLWPGPNAWRRAHGLWVLERRHELEDALLASAARDPDALVRVHAQHILAERTPWASALRELALIGLRDKDAFVQRAAADALGRHPEPANVSPLLALRQTVPADDTHLLHAVRMALRDQLRTPDSWQLPLFTWRDEDVRAIADVALGVPTADSAKFLLAYLQSYPEDPRPLPEQVRHVARYGAGNAAQTLLKLFRARHATDLVVQASLLRKIAQGTEERGMRLDDDIVHQAGELARLLIARRDGSQVTAGIDLAAALKLQALRGPLAELSTDRDREEVQRSAALRAILVVDPAGAVDLFSKLLADPAEAIALREQGAGLLAQINQDRARARLLETLPVVPARLQSAIAVGLASSAPGSEKLLEAVAGGKASARLLLERPVEVRLVQRHIPDLKGRVEQLTRGLPPAEQQLQELLGSRRDGFVRAQPDAHQGAVVFEKHCAACHQLAGKGTKIGPQLDGIGIRGLDRVLEDVLDPNRNVDQAFRTTTLVLKTGQLVTGLQLREEGEILVLADSQGKEVRVARSAVEEQTVSQMSPMPANFAEQILESDFYDLMAYLLAQRAAK